MSAFMGEEANPGSTKPVTRATNENRLVPVFGPVT